MWIERNGSGYRIRDMQLTGAVDDDGEPIAKKVTIASGFPTKASAKLQLKAMQVDRARGDFIDPRSGRVTLAEWIDRWWPIHEFSLKPTARHSESGRVRNHIRAGLGHVPLDELDTLTVQTWTTRLRNVRTGKPLAPKTVRNCHGMLHKILLAAVAQRLIRSNPCADSHLPKIPHREMMFLNEPQVGRLLAEVPEHWKPLVLLLVSTGLRWGEAAGLRVKDVDVLAGKLTVLRAMHELSGSGEIVFTEPKTERARRTVTFPKTTVGMPLASLLVGKYPGELVFSAPMGGPARARNFRRSWLKWVERAGLTGLRIHDLRHSHAAHLISAGVPLTAISRRLGHTSIAVTSDLYGHLLPEVDDGILAAVEAALAHIDVGDLAAEIRAELAEV